MLCYNVIIQDRRTADTFNAQTVACVRFVKGDPMNRLKYLRIVNVIIALLVLSLALSGMVRKLFPSLIPYQTFALIHPLTGFLFVFFIGIHVTLNFNWIKTNYLKRKKA